MYVSTVVYYMSYIGADLRMGVHIFPEFYLFTQQFTARADLMKMTIVNDRTIVISTEFVIVRPICGGNTFNRIR